MFSLTTYPHGQSSAHLTAPDTCALAHPWSEGHSKVATMQSGMSHAATAFFRNPSPWWQSGASVHLLPPFSAAVYLAKSIESEFTCTRSPSLQLLPSLHPASPPACSRPKTFRPQQSVQPLARPLQQHSAALLPTSPQQPLQAQLPVPSSRQTTNHSSSRGTGDRLNRVFRPHRNAVRPISGGRRFACNFHPKKDWLCSTRS